MSFVFINYAREDFELAIRLSSELISHGIEVWIDKENILGGSDFSEVIEEKIRRCTHFLPLLSPSSVNKAGFVQREIKLALDINKTSPRRVPCIIPVRLAQSKSQFEEINSLEWVDLFPSFEFGFEKLLVSLQAAVSAHSTGKHQTHQIYNLQRAEQNYSLGRRCLENRQYSEAKSLFGNAIRFNPQHERALLNHCIACLADARISNLLLDDVDRISLRLNGLFQSDESSARTISGYLLSILKIEYYQNRGIKVLQANDFINNGALILEPLSPADKKLLQHIELPRRTKILLDLV